MAIKTRFHTEKGKLLPAKSLANAPRSFIQALSRITLHAYPKLPWMPFSAIKEFEQLIKPTWKVVEVGSGMSTIWFASRCSQIISIEASEDWYEKLSEIVKQEGFKNIDLRYEWMSDRMSDFSEHPDKSLDLVIVDGGPREECVQNALSKVKPGGYIYVDNIDNQALVGNAEQILLKWINHDPRYYKFFADFVPGSFAVFEGLLVRCPTT